MKLETVFNPIRESSVEDHEKILWKKMMRIEFEYIEKIASFEIQPIGYSAPVNNIKKLLSSHTGIRGYLFDEYFARGGDLTEEEVFDKFTDEIVDKVALSFKEDRINWIEKALELVEEEAKKIGEVNKLKHEIDSERKEVGLLSFDISNSNSSLEKIKDPTKKRDFQILHSQLKRLNIKDEDYLLYIHFEALFKKKVGENKNKTLPLEDSLKELAITIIDKYPEVRAIFAQSWIMDSVIADKIGFEIYDQDQTVRSNDSFWGQFIDKDGQIKEKEVSQFLATGKPKYAVSAGYILVEDFLNKYLPKERRGKILLKESKQDILKEIELEEEALRSIVKDWNNLSENSLKEKMLSLKFMKEFSETEGGKEFLEFILKLKREGKNPEEVKDTGIKEIYDKTWFEFKKQVAFTNKEVFIES